MFWSRKLLVVSFLIGELMGCSVVRSMDKPCNVSLPRDLCLQLVSECDLCLSDGNANVIIVAFCDE